VGRTSSKQIPLAVVAVFASFGVVVSVGCGGGRRSETASTSAATATAVTTSDASDSSAAAAQAAYNAYARAHKGDPAFAGKEVRKCYEDPGLTAQSQGIAPGSVAYDCQIWVIDTPKPFFLANTWFALDADGTVLPY
jgi:hypothetical protein